MTSEENDQQQISKQNKFQFFKKELAIYCSQIYLFFWVAFLASACFTSEEKLVEYLNSIVTDKLTRSMINIAIASIITLGTVEFIAKGLKDTSFFKIISDDAALSVGRAMYTIGSTISGACLAVAAFLLFSPSDETSITFLLMSFLIGFVMFLYGFVITYWVKRQEVISGT